MNSIVIEHVYTPISIDEAEPRLHRLREIMIQGSKKVLSESQEYVGESQLQKERDTEE